MMTFMFPHAPSSKAGVQELADFAELRAWDHGSVSAREIVRALNQLDDNDHNVGCEDDEVENTDKMIDVFHELDRRSKACCGGYPFTIEYRDVLNHSTIEPEHAKQVLYRYLLLSTRLNMLKQAKHAKLNGTELFEEYSALVLESYLGGDAAKSLVFGTAAGSNFGDKVIALSTMLREGGGYRSIDKSGSTANDGKLDAVAWIPFADQREGQLIVFTQCKTGTSWRGHVTQCQPIAFAKKWLRRGSFIVDPVRAFCVAEALDASTWQSLGCDAGIVFDRCRLIEFSGGVKGELLDSIKTWTQAAKKVARTDSLKQNVKRPPKRASIKRHR